MINGAIADFETDIGFAINRKLTSLTYAPLINVSS